MEKSTNIREATSKDSVLSNVLTFSQQGWPSNIVRNLYYCIHMVDTLRSFASHGLLLQLVSDNRPQFVSAEFTELLQSNGVKRICCAPYHPASNGLAERFVRTFKAAMKAGNATTQPVHRNLLNFLLRYCSSPHLSTGRTPASLFFHHELCTQMDLLKPKCKNQVLSSQSNKLLEASICKLGNLLLDKQ